MHAKIESAAHDGAFGMNPIPLPTQAMLEAGNYRVGKVAIHGLPISIEQPRNSFREGVGKDGKAWRTRLAGHYGYVRGTKDQWGEPVDVFIGPHPESRDVWVINQEDTDSRAFDEHKIVIGALSEDDARSIYVNSYDRGWTGEGSIVHCTVEQLKWWLKHGNTKIALEESALSHDGENAMQQNWDSTANPVGTTLAALLYDLRRDDEDGLLLDSVSESDIMEASDGESILDALVVQASKLERKMTQLQAIMANAGSTVKPVAMQITNPFKQHGTTNIAVIYELSDGQTVTVFMHNPDTTPNKILPTDELVSWKWMLNKKDITILVAPEKGQDLNPREVGRRIMRLAEKNSTRFQQANQKRSERLSSIQSTKDRIAAKETQLADLASELELLEDKAAAVRSKQAEQPGAEQGATVTGEHVVAEIAPETIPTAQVITNQVESDTHPQPGTGAVATAAVFDPTSPEGYAQVMASDELQTKYQDTLDSFFQERIVAVRNGLYALDWLGVKDGSGDMAKNGYRAKFQFKQVGAGKNVVGYYVRIEDGNGGFKAEIGDDLTRTPEEMAAQIDAVVTNSGEVPAAAAEPEPVKEPVPDVSTTEQVAAEAGEAQGAEAAQEPAESNQADADRAFLQSVIDGTADMMAADLADKLTAIHERNKDDADLMILFNGAANAYSAAMIAAAKEALG